MKRKIKFSLIASGIVILLLITASISVFAATPCKSLTLAFQRTYSTDMGCSYVNVPITLKTKSMETKISAPSGLNIYSYASAWRGDGSLIDMEQHSGFAGTSESSFIWYVATPTRTLHVGTIEEAPGTVGDCNGYHSRQYQ
ncbi:MAG: hypothetical protein RR552_08130 [Oscillospiraceae bacterium]